jgi:glycosyltransferase involved in cell wall biosynthesis
LALRLLFDSTPPPVVALVPDVLVRVRPRGSDEDYSDSRTACAAYVLEHHRAWRRRIPQLWASYHAIVGAEQARLGHLGSARRHFAAALVAYPRREHAARLALSLLPPAASAAWPVLGRRPRPQSNDPGSASPPATVLFVAIASGLGGSTRSLATLLGHLENTRRVVACPSPTPFTEVLDEREVFDQRMILPGEGLPRMLARASAAITLAAYARRHRAELSAIHANGLSERTLVALAALLSRKPVVVWVHDWNVSPWSRRLAPLLKRMARSTRFVAVSEEAKAMLAAARIASAEEIEIVPNPIDTADVRATRRPLGPGVTVGYIGAPAPYKGFQLLPSVVRSPSAASVRWIVFSGPESAMSDVWRELHAFPADLVELPGKVTDVREAYARCDIVVCPSLEESFGRVVAEAMANGIPVVASDLPALRRLLGDDEAGILVPPGEVEPLVEAIRELAGDADRRERLGREGVLRVKLYEPGPVASKMARLYRVTGDAGN